MRRPSFILTSRKTVGYPVHIQQLPGKRFNGADADSVLGLVSLAESF